MSIKENLDTINQKIEGTCIANGIEKDDITLLAVSKTVDIDKITEAINCGQTSFAENKAQELVRKRNYFTELGQNNLIWHFIGHLQNNKAKYIVNSADYFHCLDSFKLAQKLEALLSKENKKLKVMIQINISSEESKSGIYPENTEKFINSLKDFKNLEIVGLMSIGSFFSNPKDASFEFKKMNSLFEKSKKIKQDNCNIKSLSMGMSHDFDVAIENGATMVRVGTSIFGKRDYK